MGVLVWFGMRLVVGAWYGGMAGKSLVGGCVGMVWYEACGLCMVHGGMAGKSLVVGCVGMVWYEACGWCMVWWHG